ncbi:MAG: fructokinase, partial [Chloroflexota bacterium]|nr:fructokinase [Chloroflexota bacterium]
RRLIERGPTVVLVTAGGDRVRIINSDEVVSIEVPAVAVVDTVGAGDAFGAAFLAAWTRAGRGRAGLADLGALAAATKFAIEVGARTVGRAGAEPPTLAELGHPALG